MIGRIVRPIDFERVLAVPARSRSPHFSVHHLGASPTRKPAPSRASQAELSTSLGLPDSALVDDLPCGAAALLPPGACWLGAVVPKRHARRAVTRTLLKRQIRAAVGRHAAQMPGGLWVVRLRAPIDRTRFPSAASEALKCSMRDELDALLASAMAARAPSRGARRR